MSKMFIILLKPDQAWEELSQAHKHLAERLRAVIGHCHLPSSCIWGGGTIFFSFGYAGIQLENNSFTNCNLSSPTFPPLQSAYAVKIQMETHLWTVCESVQTCI